MANARDIDLVVQGFIDAALWAGTDDSNPDQGGEPLEDTYDANDIEPETLAKIKADCADFIDLAGDQFAAYCEQYSPACDYTAAECFGHDFYLTRNGHGAGFWDRGLGTLGDDLSRDAKTYGTFDLCETGEGTLSHHG